MTPEGKWEKVVKMQKIENIEPLVSMDKLIDYKNKIGCGKIRNLTTVERQGM